MTMIHVVDPGDFICGGLLWSDQDTCSKVAKTISSHISQVIVPILLQGHPPIGGGYSEKYGGCNLRNIHFKQQKSPFFVVFDYEGVRIPPPPPPPPLADCPAMSSFLCMLIQEEVATPYIWRTFTNAVSMARKAQSDLIFLLQNQYSICMRRTKIH